ncbi:hypothetical protein BLNAU_1503 [Blattamonas nauphoetae]|uniref:Uncharacterized protein n=1 Tax=Blattamonas nauphoetae TaxID=2049346 RepID=A0ABQ9YI75_9EUKA|nr:hypothetical protein BLNAU_1503 [Blattamonas nauphoetae]
MHCRMESTATEQDPVSSSTNIAHLAGTARTAGRQQKRREAVLTSGTQKNQRLCAPREGEGGTEGAVDGAAASDAQGETGEENRRNAENMVDFGSDEKVVSETLPLPKPSLSPAGRSRLLWIWRVCLESIQPGHDIHPHHFDLYLFDVIVVRICSWS